MQLVGRKYTQSNSGYRYGFNGKENDNEVKGEGNQQDYGMRFYDPRLGRFLSEDPITKEYPELTPYQFASNRPIDGIDQDGLEYAPAGQGINGARESSSVKSYSQHPAVLQQTDARIEHEKIQSIIARVSAKRYEFKQTPKEATAETKQARREHFRDPETGKPTAAGRLFESKTYENLNNNIVEPIATGAIADGLGKIVFGAIFYDYAATTVYRVQRSANFLKVNDAGSVVYDGGAGYGKTVYMFVGDEAGALNYAAGKPGSTITSFDINSSYAEKVLKLKHPQELGLKSISASDAHVAGGYSRIGVHENKIEGFLKWQVPGTGKVVPSPVTPPITPP